MWGLCNGDFHLNFRGQWRNMSMLRDRRRCRIKVIREISADTEKRITI
jgi:hypothetical protein